MDIFYSDAHRAHQGAFEMYRGEQVPAYERPARADAILEALTRRGIGAVHAPRTFGLAPLRRVHTARYLAFLDRAWREWTALGRRDDALPSVWPQPGLGREREPDGIVGQLGFYAFDSGTPLTSGSWSAAQLGADVALTAQAHVAAGARAAFALVRPPGHHAGADFLGGYCFVNNAAVAAQAFLDGGARRVALLDVDYHHGNGTQDIFYERADVMYLSVHGDPATEFPFYAGRADETGRGAGRGFNVNVPLPARSPAATWFAALETLCERIVGYAPDALVVSLGVDTWADDPISSFNLRAPEFDRLGRRLARLGLPTLVVMEGGYAVPQVGENVADVLAGFDGG